MIGSQIDFALLWTKTDRSAANHTVPYGTESLFDRFLAMNCQATITWSLRDNRTYSPIRDFAYAVFRCRTDFANMMFPSNSVCGR